MEILYEDNHIIIVNKAPSEIVQGDKTGDTPISEKLEAYLKDKYDKPGNVFVGIPHRIDRPVSGIVIFAKTSKALVRLNEMFQKKEISKTYWAVVKNKPPKMNDTLVHFLIKHQEKNFTRIYNKQIEGSSRAELDYKLILELDNYYLLEIHPKTGRSHQIRAQLSKIGCPIKGDVKYGAERPNNDKSIHLHARGVEFVHPVKKETIKITANPPVESIWNDILKLI